MRVAEMRKKIGEAHWLLLLLWEHVSPEWDGKPPAKVADGNLITDEELALHLEVKATTIARWRQTLRRFGYLGWIDRGHQGRSFYLRGTFFRHANELRATDSSKPSAPVMVN